MQPAEPIKYTHISQDQFDRIKAILKGKGANISANKESLTLDLVPMDFEYVPETQVLIVRVQEPFWLASGMAAGFLHQIVAQATLESAIPAKAPEVGRAPEGSRLAEKGPTPSHAAEKAHPHAVKRAS